MINLDTWSEDKTLDSVEDCGPQGYEVSQGCRGAASVCYLLCDFGCTQEYCPSFLLYSLYRVENPWKVYLIVAMDDILIAEIFRRFIIFNF